MLVSRQHDSEQNHWSVSKYETLYHKPASSPRMSHHYDTPLSTQSDWQGQQYSFLPSGDNHIYSQSYDHGQAPNGSVGSQAQPRSAADASAVMDIDSKSESNSLSPSLSHRRSDDPLGLRAHRQPSPIPEQSENQGEMYAQKAAESTTEGSTASANTAATSIAVSSVSSASQSSELPPVQARSEDPVCKQEEDEDVLDDDDMDGDVEGITPEMTPAERTAARRKMKRFRYDAEKTIAMGEDRLMLSQAHSPANALSHERVRQAATPGCRAQRALVKRNSWTEPSAGPSLVPEQVGLELGIIESTTADNMM